MITCQLDRFQLDQKRSTKSNLIGFHENWIVTHFKTNHYPSKWFPRAHQAFVCTSLGQTQKGARSLPRSPNSFRSHRDRTSKRVHTVPLWVRKFPRTRQQDRDKQSHGDRESDRHHNWREDTIKVKGPVVGDLSLYGGSINDHDHGTNGRIALPI